MRNIRRRRLGEAVARAQPYFERPPALRGDVGINPVPVHDLLGQDRAAPCLVLDDDAADCPS